MRLRLVALLAALAAVFVFVAFRLHALDAGSRSAQAAGVVSRTAREIVRLDRPSGTDVVVEICSRALETPDSMASVRFTLFDRQSGRDVLEARVDPRVVRRVPGYGCAKLVSAQAGRGSSKLSLRGSSDAPFDATIVGRIITRRALTPLDYGAVALLGLLSLAVLVVAIRASSLAIGSVRDATKLAIGLVLVSLATFVVVSKLPIGGALGGLVRGGALLASQLILIAWLAPRESREGLGFLAPGRIALYLGIAPLAALLVRGVALVAAKLLPALAPSSVVRLALPSAGWTRPETVLDSRSGILAISAVAIVTPVVEELFFRGLLFGALERARGKKFAAIVTAIAFVLAHAPQTKGDPASLISIATLSIVATALRMKTGSVLPSALMHLFHNAALVLISLLASA